MIFCGEAIAKSELAERLRNKLIDQVSSKKDLVPAGHGITAIV
jgi:hypothetical protein